MSFQWTPITILDLIVRLLMLAIISSFIMKVPLWAYLFSWAYLFLILVSDPIITENKK